MTWLAQTPPVETSTLPPWAAKVLVVIGVITALLIALNTIGEPLAKFFAMFGKPGRAVAVWWSSRQKRRNLRSAENLRSRGDLESVVVTDLRSKIESMAEEITELRDLREADEKRHIKERAEERAYFENERLYMNTQRARERDEWRAEMAELRAQIT